MAFDPENSADIGRLNKAIIWSEKKLRPFREQKKERLTQMVGSHYGENGASDRVPINMTQLGVRIMNRSISTRFPQGLVTTRSPELTSAAVDFELALNYQIKQMDLSTQLDSVKMEAILGMGIMKVGVAPEGEDSGEAGYCHSPGMIFADPVLFEDYITDMTAKRRDQIGYEGNRFRVPLDWARDNPLFDKKLREELTAADLSENSTNGGDDSKSETLSQGTGPFNEEYEDHIELIEIWMPRERLVLTLVDGKDKVLRVVRWEGPKSGPFRKLGFGEVPGNLIPLCPASSWEDLHSTTNRLFNKAVRQAERQKTLLGVQAHAKDDGQRIVDAEDGQAIHIDSKDGIQEFSTGGASQQTLGMVVWAKDMLSYMGGNWDAIGGLASQSDTVGQDRMLAASANQTVREMQEITLKFAKEVIEDIAWYLWTDPLVEMQLTKKIPNTTVEIPITWNQDRKSGKFFQYNFDVDPYSLKDMTPTERESAITQFVTQVLLPASPMMAQSGAAIDWEKFIKLFSKNMRLPEMNDLITYAAGERAPVPGPATPSGPGMPANTTRNYVRESRSGATRQGKDQVLVQTLMGGGGAQPSEMAGLLRPSA